MTLSRRAAWFLVGFALWNLYVWAIFVKNVYPDHHFDSFFVVHAVIGGLTVLLGAVVGSLGARALRAHRAARGRDDGGAA
jgi:hypothetical protein